MIATLLVIVQSLSVLFLWTHDWIPLGRLNDIAAVRRADSTARLITITVIQSLPFTVLLALSAAHLGKPWPHSLTLALWIAHSVLLAGELRGWWWPYLVQPDPVRAVRYQAMFGRTHAFLPVRNGLVPNTAHVALHACTVLTLILLALARR
jgi:hypothetical protein